jgi:serine/threonine protein kinase/dipeptidyl aminopeptidase/acylaminoacyl peptidase
VRLTSLSHYRILSTLGTGGMGEVYLAEDTKLGRRVALKVLAPEVAADPERRDRFEREARAVAALNHPNIVTIHSVEEDDGVRFLTMELVEGKTLGELIPPEGLSIDRFLSIAVPLTDAVAAAHDRGITHRDLKPANVMVNGEGRVKVLDFGLAKLRDVAVGADESTFLATSRLTTEGRIMGTVAYMSPEQAEGKPVDQRSDVFSLGILLYEMATGKKPFQGDTNMSILSAILKDTPQSVTDLRADLPLELARIIRRALQKDPALRYQSARDLRDDLQALKQDVDTGEILRTRSSLNVPPVAGSSKRRLGWIGLTLGVLGLIVPLILHLAERAERATPADSASHFTSIDLTRLTNTGTAGLAALSPNDRYVVHVVEQGDQQSLWIRQTNTPSNVQIVAPAEVRYDGLTFSQDGDYVFYTAYQKNGTFAELYRVPILGGPPVKILDDIDTAPTFSPDGKRFAFVRGLPQEGASAIFIANADGTGERRIAALPQPVTFAYSGLSWSPDAARIVAPVQRSGVETQAHLALVTVDDGSIARLGDKEFQQIGMVAWLGDGSGVVFDASERELGPGAPGQIWIASYPDGSVRRVTSDLNNYTSIGTSTGGRAIVAVQQELRANLWLAENGDERNARRLTSSTGGREGVAGIHWTSDGRIIYGASTTGSWDLWVCDADGGNARRITTDPGTEGLPIVSADGSRLTYLANRAGTYDIWISGVDGADPKRITEGLNVISVQFAPDGSLVYIYNEGRIPHVIRQSLKDGGAKVQLLAADAVKRISDGLARFQPLLILPGGERMFISFMDAQARAGRYAIARLDGSEWTRLAIVGRQPWLAPDGKGIDVMQTNGGVDNIWRYPLDGSAPKQVSTFTTDRLFGFGWSRDGKRLAVARGTTTADVVLIRDAKQ